MAAETLEQNGQTLWQKLLERALQDGASDLYLTAGQPAFLRRNGLLEKIILPAGAESSQADVPAAGAAPAFEDAFLKDDFMEQLVQTFLTAGQLQSLARGQEVDFSLTFAGQRLRGNFYQQQNHLALVLRFLPPKIPSLQEIHAPAALYDLLEAKRGLVLVTGSTGSGKTTTLASFLQAVNEKRAAHILTLEDPIEYVFPPAKCFISQRELGRDFSSFAGALRSALREMPDILLVGEIRDRETMTTALQAAETGLLVLGTLHTRGAAEAVRRMENFYPPGQQPIVRAEIAEVITAVFAQQLLPARTGGRVPLVEVLLREPAVCSLIRQGRYSQLEGAMMSHQKEHMQTRGLALQRLWQQGLLSAAVYEEVRCSLKGEIL
ncbi:type IV pilus twitching motility protein PilT [Mitsuokella sp.]|uniref:type IV pilus twitching motility protein PilT n=1 Tax=Mitsuokella sp. TaxID=2049034 RepID=UPI003D7DF571